MKLIRKVGQMLGFHAREKSSSEQATEHAIERVRSVGRRADELNNVLQGYLKADEPFKAFAVDIFERGQESRIHHGPPRQ